jgi:hypothetical protein
MDGSRLAGWLPLIPLLPFLGFVLNGLFGRAAGKRFVAFVGAGLPITAFVLALAGFFALNFANRTTAVSTTTRGRVRVIEALQDGFTLYDSPEDKAAGIVRVGQPVEEVRARLMSMPDVRVGLLG